jgi:hypothetical protein
MSLLYYVSSVFYFRIFFILLLHDPVFFNKRYPLTRFNLTAKRDPQWILKSMALINSQLWHLPIFKGCEVICLGALNSQSSEVRVASLLLVLARGFLPWVIWVFQKNSRATCLILGREFVKVVGMSPRPHW